jgi:hypothetical protein
MQEKAMERIDNSLDISRSMTLQEDVQLLLESLFTPAQLWLFKSHRRRYLSLHEADTLFGDVEEDNSLAAQHLYSLRGLKKSDLTQALLKQLHSRETEPAGLHTTRRRSPTQAKFRPQRD